MKHRPQARDVLKLLSGRAILPCQKAWVIKRQELASEPGMEPSDGLSKLKFVPLHIPGSEQRHRAPDILRDSTQLYLTTIVVDDASGAVQSFPAIYVWNQNRAVGSSGSAVGLQRSNLTPTWSAAGLPPLANAPASDG